MGKFLKLSEEEIKLGFISSYIEFIANELKTSYIDIYRRMTIANMLNDSIYDNYEAVQTQKQEIIRNYFINGEQKLPDMEHLPVDIELILLSGRIGIISNIIAESLNIDGIKALELFYESETCRRLHNKETGLYLYGDLYIAEDFLLEHSSNT